jgi:hypothetical protein
MLEIRTIMYWLAASAVVLVARAGLAVQPQRHQAQQEQVLLSAQSLAEQGEQAYLAFPDIVRVGPQNLLISYKRGRSHANDPGAMLEVLRFNTSSRQIVSRKVLGGHADLIYQMGEWIEFPNGRLANLVDVQQLTAPTQGKRNERVGVYWTTSDDLGQSFTPMRKLGPISGVEYGYVFDAIVSGQRLYMLAMNFPEMSASRSMLDAQGKRIYGEVSVVKSDDNGQSWGHVRNLSRELGGIKINESALVATDSGFILCTRGYDNQARLHQLDQQFRLQSQRSLTDDYDFIGQHLGRPRLFFRDGELYLLGRNTLHGAMELALLRIHPGSLSVEAAHILDPQPGSDIQDGYYAVPYFQETEQGTLFHVITYRRRADQTNPDLVRLEFLWDLLR